MFANKRWFDKSRFAASNATVDTWRRGADAHVPVFDPYRHTMRGTRPYWAEAEGLVHLSSPKPGAEGRQPLVSSPRCF